MCHATCPAMLAPVHKHRVRRAPLHPPAAHTAPHALNSSDYNHYSPLPSPAGRCYEMPKALNIYTWDTGTPHREKPVVAARMFFPGVQEEAGKAGSVKAGKRKPGKKVKRSAVLSRDTHTRVFSDFASS